MKNNNAVFITVGILLVIVFALFYFNTNPQKFDWTETYSQARRQQPYNLDFAKNIIEKYFPNHSVQTLRKRVRESLKTNDGGTYMFVGNSYYLTFEDADTLLTFVGKGGTAFISCNSVPFELMDYLYTGECGEDWKDYHAVSDTIATLNFFHPKLHDEQAYKCYFNEKDKLEPYTWRSIDTSYFCDITQEIPNTVTYEPEVVEEAPVIVEAPTVDEYDTEETAEATVDDTDYNDTDETYGVKRSSFTALGYINAADKREVNFARIKYGNGFVYLHTTPLTFTNYHLCRAETIEYVGKLLSHLKEGEVYWDAIAATQDYSAPSDRRHRQDSAQTYKTPLEYILSQAELGWAWYGLLAMGLLFLIFRSKRRQRIIPVLEENTNTSLAFVESVGRLYFQQNNHQRLIEQKMKQFLLDVKNKYYLNLKDEEPILIKKIAIKSGLSEEKIALIFNTFGGVKRSGDARPDDLVRFYQVMDFFYKNAK